MDEKVKIHVLHCGKVLVDEALPFSNNSRNPLAYTGMLRSKKHRVWLPVSAYLIEHPKGKVLVDTGWGAGVRENPEKELGFTVCFASFPSLPQGQLVSEQLSELGIAPSDLDYVFLTHLDADHAGGLKAVRDAKNIIANEEELKTADRKFRYVPRMWEGVPVQAVRMTSSEFGPCRLSFDLFDDGTVLLVWLPGHSDGMTGVLIQNNGRFVLLAADCGYAARSWKELILPGIMENKRQMTRSLEWVKSMSEKDNCVEVLANHDPEVAPHIVEL